MSARPHPPVVIPDAVSSPVSAKFMALSSERFGEAYVSVEMHRADIGLVAFSRQVGSYHTEEGENGPFTIMM